MTRFEITKELFAQIHAAAGIVTQRCQYPAIWYLDMISRTISKEKTENCVPIPTGFQIGDLVKGMFPIKEPIPMFLSYCTGIAYSYPEAELYEIQLLTLAHLLEGSLKRLNKTVNRDELEDDPFLEP